MAVDSTELRNLVRDPDQAVFTDEDLAAAISASGDSLLRAAGIAIKSLALEYSAAGRSIRTADLAIDVTSRGRDLLEVAQSFLDDANAADQRSGASYFEVVSAVRKPVVF